jgi:hypothetical protein
MTTDHQNWIAILYTATAQISFACSLLHTFLPPWEFLDDFPTVQKIYKAVIYVIGYVAGNGRSTIYPTLSTANGTKTSLAANGNIKGALNETNDTNVQDKNIPPTH